MPTARPSGACRGQNQPPLALKPLQFGRFARSHPIAASTSSKVPTPEEGRTLVVWFDPEYLARRIEEGDRSSMEMAHEADEAISRLLGTDEHDAATAALCQVTASAPAPSAAATRWGRRVAQAITKLIGRRPRLLLILVLAVMLPATVWGTWHILTDVNRAVSAVTVSVFAMATARPLLKNLAWAANILLDTPMRAGIWLADTFDTGPADRTSA